METVCIFNPEHDLCLANGDRNFVPPQSALQFADNCHGIMQIVHNAASASVNTIPQLADIDFSNIEIIPWGWNATLKHSLLRLDFPAEKMPGDDLIAWIRKMQHRAEFLPLLNESKAIYDTASLQEYLHKHEKIILKAPWSSSGRGLRRIFGNLGEKDIAWAEKMILEQNCFIAEPLRDIKLEFALEYDNREFVGYSLFSSKNGIYESNVLLYDNEIEKTIYSHSSGLASIKSRLEQWLDENIFPFYRYPLGIDCYMDSCDNLHISEINLRHTMGLVAHAFLQQHPESHGKIFYVNCSNGISVK